MKNKFKQAGLEITASSREEFDSSVEVWDITGELDGKTQIKWYFELEMRNYGIKSMYITVPDQEVSINWENDSTETRKLTNVKTEVTLDMYGEFSGIHLIPQTLEHSDGEWTLKF